MFNLDEDKDLDKVSIRSVYLASDDLNVDVRARESVAMSFERPLSPQALRYPAITDGRSSDLVSPAASASDDMGIDDPLVLPSRQRSDSSVKEEESVDLSAARRCVGWTGGQQEEQVAWGFLGLHSRVLA